MKLKIVCFVLILNWPFNSCQHVESAEKENVADDNQVIVKTLNGVVRGVRRTALGETVDVFLGVIIQLRCSSLIKLNYVMCCRFRSPNHRWGICDSRSPSLSIHGRRSTTPTDCPTLVPKVQSKISRDFQGRIGGSRKRQFLKIVSI